MAIGSFKPGMIEPSGIRLGGSPMDERAPIVGMVMHTDSTPPAGGFGPGRALARPGGGQRRECPHHHPAKRRRLQVVGTAEAGVLLTGPVEPEVHRLGDAGVLEGAADRVQRVEGAVARQDRVVAGRRRARRLAVGEHPQRLVGVLARLDAGLDPLGEVGDRIPVIALQLVPIDVELRQLELEHLGTRHHGERRHLAGVGLGRGRVGAAVRPRLAVHGHVGAAGRELRRTDQHFLFAGEAGLGEGRFPLVLPRAVEGVHLLAVFAGIGEGFLAGGSERRVPFALRALAVRRLGRRSLRPDPRTWIPPTGCSWPASCSRRQRRPGQRQRLRTGDAQRLLRRRRRWVADRTILDPLAGGRLPQVDDAVHRLRRTAIR